MTYFSCFALILSEIMILMFVLGLSAQNSSFWSSLLLIPMSCVVVYSSSSMSSYSGIIILIYVMVFIGGLMVLLVSVTTVSFQEQGQNFMKSSWLVFMSLVSVPFLLEAKEEISTSSILALTSWFIFQGSFILDLAVVLLVGLMVITEMMSKFKGLIRSI